MFVADVKCAQATRQTVPNSRTGGSAKSFCLRSCCAYIRGLFFRVLFWFWLKCDFG